MSILGLIEKVRGKWLALPIIRQFAYLGALVIGGGTLFIGSWVAERIEETVVSNSAASAALYMTSLVEPIFLPENSGTGLSKDQIEALDALFATPPLAQRIVSFKIWGEGGLVVYSSRKDLVGRRFNVGPRQKRAWSGEVAAEIDDLSDAENDAERKLGIPILEIYAPLHASGSGRVIAVCEFYDNANSIVSDVRRAKLSSWLVVGSSGFAMFLVLMGVVRPAGKTIEGQQKTLTQQVSDLTRALRRNSELRSELDAANRRSVEANDRFLRRIGAELHDGPAQLLALSLLRLDGIAHQPGAEPPTQAQLSEVAVLRKVIGDALAEIRNISSGLALPEIQAKPMGEILQDCADAHERRTGSSVERQIEPIADDLPIAAKICFYRLAQEGLNNAFRHAGGAHQRLSLSKVDDELALEISDQGAGFDVAKALASDRLGLSWMQDRVRSLGGAFEVISKEGQGTTLRCQFRVGEAAARA